MSSTVFPSANCASCRPAPPVPSSATSVPIVKFSGLPLDQLCTPLTVQSLSSALTNAVLELVILLPHPREPDHMPAIELRTAFHSRGSNGFATPAVSPAP